VQSETNEAYEYDPKNWPESDLVTYPPTEPQEWFPSPEVQAQATDLIAVAEEQADAASGADPELVYEKTNAPLKDGKLPDYYRKTTDGTIIPITKAEYKRGMLKEFTVKHQPLPCGHKLVADHNGPRHTNCDQCWLSYFQVFGEVTKAVEEAYQSKGTEVGAELIKQLRGAKFLKHFLRFMSTVALYKESLESAASPQ